MSFRNLILLNNFKLINQQLIRKFSNTNQLNRIENVLIIGSGLMGSGIAQSCATTGKFNSITLQDVKQEQLEKAKKKMIQNLTRMKENKKSKIVEEPQVIADRVTLSTEIKPVSDKNLLIVEAVPEILDLKQELFKNLCDQFKSNDSVIYATNTSSLPCSKIAIHVPCLERFGGLHFFNPVPLMRLVEVVRLDKGTNDQTFNDLRQFVADIDKVSVACKDTPGFIVNRLLVPYMQEAIRLLERGDATIKDIDTAMKLGAGYPMGPFELLDFVGLDTNQFIVEAWEKHGDSSLNLYKSKLIDEMVKRGELGKKSGKGFYDYSSK